MEFYTELFTRKIFFYQIWINVNLNKKNKYKTVLYKKGIFKYYTKHAKDVTNFCTALTCLSDF